MSNQESMSMKSYEQSKRPLTLDEQASLLIDRGLIADSEKLKSFLSRVSYFRLSGYWYSFRGRNPVSNELLDNFRDHTTLEDVERIYLFDQQLSLFCFNAVKQIEIAFRSYFVQETSVRLGAFHYSNKSNFPNWSGYADMLSKLEERAQFKQKNNTLLKEACVSHMEAHYSDEHMPLWMASEFMDFGTLMHLMNHYDSEFWRKFAKHLDVPVFILQSWICCLHSLRNANAHHARIWNKSWGIRPKCPNRPSDIAWYASLNSSRWTVPRIGTPKSERHLALDNDRTGMLLFICQYLLTKLGYDRSWALQIEKLFNDYNLTESELKSMGLPPHCFEHPVWRIF